jgi:hypothetical protein
LNALTLDPYTGAYTPPTSASTGRLGGGFNVYNLTQGGCGSVGRGRLPGQPDLLVHRRDFNYCRVTLSYHLLHVRSGLISLKKAALLLA